MAAEGGRVECALAQLGVYSLQDAVEIAIDIAVPEPKDSKASTCETDVATRIARLMFIEVVPAATELDDKPKLHADKVDNESFARRLPPEMRPTLSP